MVIQLDCGLKLGNLSKMAWNLPETSLYIQLKLSAAKYSLKSHTIAISPFLELKKYLWLRNHNHIYRSCIKTKHKFLVSYDLLPWHMCQNSKHSKKKFPTGRRPKYIDWKFVEFRIMRRKLKSKNECWQKYNMKKKTSTHFAKYHALN